ncbi:MAG: AAA family ATPase, partial [Thermomicrobiales bacterium]|nr:AAA family ATPase [Thermomicrobiales bacterium]
MTAPIMPERAIHDDVKSLLLVARTEPGSGMTTRQAAAALGVSERTVRRAIARGALAATRERGAYRILPGAVDRYRAGAGQTPRPDLPHVLGSRRVVSLPRLLTPLVGRQAELTAACAFLVDHPRALVTLTGPAGIGKTRLALAIAETLADHGGGRFGDGAVFVDLAPIRDPEGVAPAIGRAVGVRESGGRPLLDGIIVHLHARALLLVLDNFEHVLSAAPVVSHVLAACPALAVLSTSRSPLQVRGEYVLTAPPLDVGEMAARPVGRFVPHAGASHLRVPTPHQPTPITHRPPPAVELFVARASAVRADFALTTGNEPAIATICRRLDGLPLAIELAAARCAALSPEDLLARLDHRLPLLAHGPRDVAPRHQSLREAIAWSHELLSPHEQALFAHLAIFAGGFTMEAAEAVAGVTGSGLSTLDLVTSLHAQSLLVRQESTAGTVRFGMLETVREFAREQLAASGEEPRLQRRHAEYFLDLAADVAGRVPRANLWWVPLEPEWGNLSAALAWTIAAGEPGLGMRLASALFG